MKQWAFRMIELGSPQYDGKGVRVGIFDTSPYQGLTPDIATVKSVVLAQTPSDLSFKCPASDSQCDPSCRFRTGHRRPQPRLLYRRAGACPRSRQRYPPGASAG